MSSRAAACLGTPPSHLRKIHFTDPAGFDVLLAVRQRGEVVGELAALSGEPRTASVVAVNDVCAGMIGGPVLSDFLAEYPDAARELIRTQGQRLAWANRRRVDFAARPARSKVARVLADLAAHADEQDGTATRVELSQQELASLVGIALNTAQGALHSLSAAGRTRRYDAGPTSNRGATPRSVDLSV